MFSNFQIVTIHLYLLIRKLIMRIQLITQPLFIPLDRINGGNIFAVRFVVCRKIMEGLLRMTNLDSFLWILMTFLLVSYLLIFSFFFLPRQSDCVSYFSEYLNWGLVRFIGFYKFSGF